MHTELNIQLLSIHSSPLGKLGTRDTGGMSVYLLETARKMGALGHRVDIFTLAEKGSVGSSILTLADNVRLVHLEVNAQERLTKENLFDYLPRVYDAYQEKIGSLQREYNLIHSHYWLSGCFGMMLQEEYQLPHYITFHTLGKVKNIASGDEKESTLRIFQERKLANECDCVVAFTPEDKNNLIAHCGAAPDKVAIIPCGVNMDIFKPVYSSIPAIKEKLTKEDKVLLFVGRTVPIKGIDKLLDAVALLIPEYPLKCVIVGGENKNLEGVVDIQKKIAERALDEIVFPVGRVEQEKLQYYYCAAAALVVPSLQESFGLVVLEALACGTPVIGSAVGVIPQVITEHNGYIVEAGDIHKLAAAIEQLVLQPNLTVAERNEIRDSVMHFSWDNVTDQLLNMYST